MHHTPQQAAGGKSEGRLTEKEFSYLQHLLEGELLGLKKCLTYAEQSEDDEVRTLLREQADIHHRRIDMMIALLEGDGDITHRAKQLLQGQGEEGLQHD
ncbi:MAG TPA: hypothetical protein VIL07_02405 [Symbiobacteriaceae bacterium]